MLRNGKGRAKHSGIDKKPIEAIVRVATSCAQFFILSIGDFLLHQPVHTYTPADDESFALNTNSVSLCSAQTNAVATGNFSTDSSANALPPHMLRWLHRL